MPKQFLPPNNNQNNNPNYQEGGFRPQSFNEQPRGYIQNPQHFNPNVPPERYQEQHVNNVAGFKTEKKSLLQKLKDKWHKFVHETIGLELSLPGKIAIVATCVVILLVFVWGLISTVGDNRDEQKIHDMSQIVTALDSYYENSSSVKDKRFYPISVCSSSLNEIDFEYTLRRNLIGENTEVTTHVFIEAGDFPYDKQGEYVNSLGDRENTVKCPDSIPSDGYRKISQVCDFDIETDKDCYLYTSSDNGDRYQLSYYSRVSKEFVVFVKAKDKPIQILE